MANFQNFKKLYLSPAPRITLIILNNVFDMQFTEIPGRKSVAECCDMARGEEAAKSKYCLIEANVFSPCAKSLWLAGSFRKKPGMMVQLKSAIVI